MAVFFEQPVDCESNHVSFHHEGIEYFDSGNGVIQAISAIVLTNDYNKGFQFFSVILLNESDSKNSNVKSHEDI